LGLDFPKKGHLYFCGSIGVGFIIIVKFAQKPNKSIFMKVFKMMITVFLCLLISNSMNGQALRGALIDKVKKEAVNKLTGKEQNTETPAETTSDDNSTSKPSQRSGSSKGLEKSSKDVNLSLDEAASAFSTNDYKRTRMSLTEALGNLDLMIGDLVLKSFPDQVTGIPSVKENDMIASSTAYWTGLTIHREYQQGEQWVKVETLNSSLAVFANAAVNTGYYTYSNDPSSKNVQVKGLSGVITFDENSGYKLSIAVGQQTFMVFEGVNIPDETTMLQIADAFDYENIKKMFGEK